MNFDAQAFLTSQYKGGLDTEYPVYTPGDYPGLCTKVEARINTAKETGEKFMSLDTTWEILSDQIRQEAEMDHPTARYSFIINFDDNGVPLTKGNQKLARLLEAVGLNEGDWSPMQIKGQAATVRIGPRTGEDGTIYNEVKAVAKQ